MHFKHHVTVEEIYIRSTLGLCREFRRLACLNHVHVLLALPVAVIGKAIFYPGLSFGLRGEQSVHLHHKVAGPERNPFSTYLHT